MAKKKNQQDKPKSDYSKEIVAIVIIAVAIFFLYILWADSEGGAVGGFIHKVFTGFFGQIGAYAVVIFLLIFGLHSLFRKERLPLSFYLSYLALLISTLAFIHVLALPNGDFTRAGDYGLQAAGSGLTGGLLISGVYKAVGAVGVYIFFITLTLVSLISLTKISIINILKKLYNTVKIGLTSLFIAIKKALKSEKKEKPIAQDNREIIIEDSKTRLKKLLAEQEELTSDTNSPEVKEEKKLLRSGRHLRTKHVEDENLNDSEQKKLPLITDNGEESAINGDEAPEKTEGVSDNKEAAFDPTSEDFSQSIIEEEMDKDYQIPPLSLLKSPEAKETDSQQFIRQQAHKIEETLSNFKIDARVTKVSVGPTITRFELQIGAGIKVSRVSSLENDLALSLAVKSIRIEAPIPGKAAIGIEVPNEAVNTVYLQEVLSRADLTSDPTALHAGIGLDIAGTPVISKINEMPHLLIAGATGSGKSVCINSIINSFLLQKTPQEVKLVLIDPKRVELGIYNDIPHLLTPVVTDPKKAAHALIWVVQEMEKRYQILAKVGVRNIGQFNKKIQSGGIHDLDLRQMPYIVIIIDELADLMIVAQKEVEDSICRIAQLGRAAGIHLVVGTQRPSVDVITGLIKANIPARIAFAVSSSIDSRTILDMSGAERLLGSGDMLYMPQGMNKPLRVQGSYISEKEIAAVVNFIKEQRPANYQRTTFVQEAEIAPESSGDRDELFEDALLTFIDYGSASISLLQRRFRIGYTRAARIVDQLEDAGAISGYAGSKPREVLEDSEIVQEILAKNSRL